MPALTSISLKNSRLIEGSGADSLLLGCRRSRSMMGERRVMQEALFYGFSLESGTSPTVTRLLRKIDPGSSTFRTFGRIWSPITARSWRFSDRSGADDPDADCWLLPRRSLGTAAVRGGPPQSGLSCWFCRLGLDGGVPDHSTFSKNRHGRFRESDSRAQAVRDGGGALHEGEGSWEAVKLSGGRRQHHRGGRASTAKRRQGRGLLDPALQPAQSR